MEKARYVESPERRKKMEKYNNCDNDDNKNNTGGEDNHGGVVKVKHVVNGGYNQDLPSEDDVCPICFDSFIFPCKSNCGHWFCANCILQYWMYKSTIRPCKCPMCSFKIINLKQGSSSNKQDDDLNEITKKVHKYNGLFAGGAYSAFQRVVALPLHMRAIFKVAIDPDGLRCIYYITRLLGLFLALLYEIGEYEFVPTGGFGIQKMFDLIASLLVVSFFLVGVAYRWVVRRRLRNAAMRLWIIYG